jgi:hypothetical protein
MALYRIEKFCAHDLLKRVDELLADSRESGRLSLFGREAFISQLESCQMDRFSVDQTLAVRMKYGIIEIASCSGFSPSCFFFICSRSFGQKLRFF